MKKFFTLCVSALCAMAVNATALTESLVGNEDNTSAWWTAFSNYYSISSTQSAHITFKNYSDKVENFHNFLLVTNVAGTQRDGEGYAEYFVLRSDNYGWGNCYDVSTLSSTYNWDTFKDDLDGSTVDMTLKIKDKKIAVKATITTASGTVYKYSFTSLSIGTDKADFFLTVEDAHLTDLNVEYLTADAEDANSIGEIDNTTAWWSAFSDYYTVNSTKTTHITFTNYSAKSANSDNWLLVANKLDTKRSGNGYAEYFVLRNDNYGWGTYYDETTLSSAYNWDTFKDDMDGSTVDMTLNMEDQKVVVNAVITTTTGTKYNYAFTSKAIGADEASWFLTTEKGHISYLNVEYVDKSSTGIEEVENAKVETENSAVYNIAGQKVANNAKGLLIKNGHKYFNK